MSTYTPQAGSLAAEVIGTFQRKPEIEEMSIADIIRLWPHKAKTSNVNPCLATPLEHRILTRARNAKGDLVYRRGLHFSGKPTPAPQPPQAGPPPVATDPPTPAAPPAAMVAAPAPAPPPPAPAPQTSAPPSPDVVAVAPPPAAAAPKAQTPARKGPLTGRAAVRLPELDPDSIVVRTAVPLPARWQAAKGVTKYDALFAKLLEPGQSFTAPVRYKAALMKAAIAYRKTHSVHLVVRVIDGAQCGVWRK